LTMSRLDDHRFPNRSRRPSNTGWEAGDINSDRRGSSGFRQNINPPKPLRCQPLRYLSLKHNIYYFYIFYNKKFHRPIGNAGRIDVLWRAWASQASLTG
jgi:hypothetical protein